MILSVQNDFLEFSDYSQVKKLAWLENSKLDKKHMSIKSNLRQFSSDNYLEC